MQQTESSSLHEEIKRNYNECLKIIQELKERKFNQEINEEKEVKRR